MDHGIFRKYWANHFEIAPGIFRSNHPPDHRLRAYHKAGLKSVISLRGHGITVANNLEKQTCIELPLILKSIDFTALRPPKAKEILELVEYFYTLPKPLLIHCKSGADRAGLASAIYLMVIENMDVQEAKKMLSKKYLHFKSSQTGVLDHILDTFEVRQRKQPISFEDWVEKEYDPDEIQATFNAGRNR